MRFGVIVALMGLAWVPVPALAQVQVQGGVTLGFAFIKAMTAFVSSK